MRSSHTPGAVSATFDDPNLVSHAGLVPLVRLMENIGSPALADELVRLGDSAGADAATKITTIVAGTAAGADSFSDLNLLREGGMDRLFDQVRAPSTIGTFPRWFTIGHNAQLENPLSRTLRHLTGHTELLPGLDELAFLDPDSKITEVHSRKQGAAHGHTKVSGLNFPAATLTTDQAAPVITGTRLRGGNADTRRKATSFTRTQLRTARACGATGKPPVRTDSGYHAGELITEITHAGAWFSVTVPHREPIRAAIAAIDEAAWTPITYAHPVRDEDTDEPISTAQIAETTYTAFTNPTLNPGQKTTGRLIARRTPIPTPDGQGELVTVYRHHAFLTNNPADIVTADAQHRDRAGAIEHVFADLQAGAPAHFPGRDFQANAAWLTLAALTHNLLRALGCLAGRPHATARTPYPASTVHHRRRPHRPLRPPDHPAPAREPDLGDRLAPHLHRHPPHPLPTHPDVRT